MSKHVHVWLKSVAEQHFYQTFCNPSTHIIPKYNISLRTSRGRINQTLWRNNVSKERLQTCDHLHGSMWYSGTPAWGGGGEIITKRKEPEIVLERKEEGTFHICNHCATEVCNQIWLFVFSLSLSLLCLGLNKFSHPYPNTQLSLLQIVNVSGRRNVDNLPKSSPTAATPSLSSVDSHLYRNPQLWL